jgi:hypothetical protein
VGEEEVVPALGHGPGAGGRRIGPVGYAAQDGGHER